MAGDATYIATLDVGTSTVKCFIYDHIANVRGYAVEEIELKYPNPGWVEIEPDHLWEQIVSVFKKTLANANITASQLHCLGICTQRSSFITWDRDTGKPFHNFITWKDLRANTLVKNWNESLFMKAFRYTSKFLYLVSQQKRFLAASMFRLMNVQVTLRLVWALKNIPLLQVRVKEGKAMFGTIDTWLVYRLTGGKVHATDYSNASATGIFDPFVLSWGQWALNMFGIPSSMLPKALDTCGDFGTCRPEVFGSPIPIVCVVGDQGASMFGSCCFKKGDMKVTLGTGTFVNINTGRKPHVSDASLYPVIAWKRGEDLVYVAEGCASDTGTIIDWAKSLGLYSEPSDSSAMAESVRTSGGVYFVPAFSGLQAPINDFQAASGFLGLKPSSTRAHLVRAMLESIAFRVFQLYHVVQKETSFSIPLIRVDGGVSRNNFIVQMIATLTEREVERPQSSEMSSLGTAFLAGLSSGIWQSPEDLSRLRRINRVFKPEYEITARCLREEEIWEKVITRFKNWYSTPADICSLH